MSNALHITNGDAAAARIKAAGIPGMILPWRDVLHEGPVPTGLSLDELRPIRVRFIADQGWGEYDLVERSFYNRDGILHQFRDYDEVALWFEHDLYDQLQLIQILDYLAGAAPHRTKLSLIDSSEYLTAIDIDDLPARYTERRPVDANQLLLGSIAWKAFRSDRPSDIAALLADDISPLPHLGNALQRHLQEFPSVRNGLSRSEIQALEAIDGGNTSLREAFIKAHHEREEAIFLGDTVFASYLARLSQGEYPLVLLADGSEIVPPRNDTNAEEFWDRPAALTDTGRQVLSGEKDAVALRGIDRWLGGVHLQGFEVEWRWDESISDLQSGRS